MSLFKIKCTSSLTNQHICNDDNCDSDDETLAAVHHPDDGNIHGPQEVHEERAEDRSVLRLAHALRMGLPTTHDG